MKNFMSILLICICGVLAACSNDNIYEKEDSGFVVRSKELIPEEDITLATPWKFKYNVIDYSNVDGNMASIVKPGDFYYYSSRNYLVGDTLVFTTKKSLKKYHADEIQIEISKIDLVAFNSVKALAVSLKTTVAKQHMELIEIAALEESLREMLNISDANLQKELQKSKTLKANLQKLTKFKNDLKKLVGGDSATP